MNLKCNDSDVELVSLLNTLTRCNIGSYAHVIEHINSSCLVFLKSLTTFGCLSACGQMRSQLPSTMTTSHVEVMEPFNLRSDVVSFSHFTLSDFYMF